MVMEISCVIATLLFVTANVIRIVFYAHERKREHWDWELYSDLDPDYIQTEWDFREDNKGLWIASGFLNAIAWMFFAYPVIQMAWLLSAQGSKGLMYNLTIMLLALGGALTEWLANLFWIGMKIATTKLATEFNLDEWVRNDVAGTDEGMGWRSLEVNHVSLSGFIWFVDAFEWLCLSGLFIATFLSVRLWRMDDPTSFGARWNSLSLFIGLVCILEFVAEILRFEGFRTFGPIAMVYAILNRLILIPAWLISLGFILPRVALKQAYTDTNPIASELALAELSSAVDVGTSQPGPTTPTFSIDDDDDDAGPTNPASPPVEAFAKNSESASS
jgi:hypothetical protein